MQRRQFICLMFLLVIFTTCDPGGNLLLKNGGHKKVVDFDNATLSFKIKTIGNINFSIMVTVAAKSRINIFADSLNIFYKGSKYEYDIRYDGNRYLKKTIDIENKEEIFFYGFDIYDSRLRKNDTISIFAKNYVRINHSFFNLDTIKFVVTDDYSR